MNKVLAGVDTPIHPQSTAPGGAWALTAGA